MKSRLSLAAAALLALLLSSSQAQDQGKAAPPLLLCDPTHLTSTPLTSAFPLPAMCSCISSLNKKKCHRESKCVCLWIDLFELIYIVSLSLIFD